MMHASRSNARGCTTVHSFCTARSATGHRVAAQRCVRTSGHRKRRNPIADGFLTGDGQNQSRGISDSFVLKVQAAFKR